MTSNPIRLLLVDDHSLFRRGLRALLQQDTRLQVVAEAGDVGEALRHLTQHAPDVILLDNHMPGVRGVDAIPSLKAAAPQARILMLTVSESAQDLATALRSGADGYLLKTMESDHLCETIVRVLEGESVVSPELMSQLIHMVRTPARGGGPETASVVGLAVAASPPPYAPTAPSPAPALAPTATLPGTDALSPREQEILALIARGDSNKLIARELDIAETTVKIHVQHILRKLNLSSRVQAAVFAVNHGLDRAG